MIGMNPFTRSQLLQVRLPGLTFLSLETPRVAFATSVETLNTLLPEGGLVTGSFVEILSTQEGAGAYSLALTLAQRTAARREAWAVVDPEETFYPPAAAAMGYDLNRLILLRPQPNEDAWAFTQLLRSADISVCFWMTSRMDNMVFRRLQLAAECGDGLGFVMRPMAAERKPSWSSLRLMASRRSTSGGAESRRRLCVRVLHTAGRFVDSTREVEVAL
jgi:hypothetical protein